MANTDSFAPLVNRGPGKAKAAVAVKVGTTTRALKRGKGGHTKRKRVKAPKQQAGR